MGDTPIMHQLAELEIDMLGFIFYPRSPRFVEDKIAPPEVKKLPQGIKKTGVFVNADEATILQKAERYYLDTIQLHGSESPELCKALKEHDFRILKAFNLTKNNDYQAYESFCDFFIFDTPSEKHGGTGEKFDWSLLDTYKGKIPFLLSGGIGPNDATEVMQIKHPKLAGIDINSKFEKQPGIKDVVKIKKFLQDFSLLKANSTEAGNYLWEHLSAKKFKGWRFRRQHPVNYFITDFYCPEAKLIIEVEGGNHQLPVQHEHDDSGKAEFNESGVKIIRFTNEQILSDIDNTLDSIESVIKQRI